MFKVTQEEEKLVKEIQRLSDTISYSLTSLSKELYHSEVFTDYNKDEKSRKKTADVILALVALQPVFQPLPCVEENTLYSCTLEEYTTNGIKSYFERCLSELDESQFIEYLQNLSAQLNKSNPHIKLIHEAVGPIFGCCVPISEQYYDDWGLKITIQDYLNTHQS